MSEPAPLPRILHVHAVFEGPAADRCARLISAFAEAEHAVVSGDPQRRSAAALIDRRRKVAWPKFPPLAGKPWPGRLKRLAAAMAGYDLICTYGWGAIDAALAHTLFADVYRLPPLVHHEDEAGGRSFYRRIALGRSAALVVPTRRLERIALETWQQPRSRVRLIPGGIDLRPYAKVPKADALPRVIKRKDERWVGAETDEGAPALVWAFAGLPEAWQLVLLGEEGREAALAEAERSGIEDRVHAPGDVADPAKVIGLFDVFALSPSAVSGPIVEAMAAGLPVAAPRAGDVGELLSSDNGPFLSASGDERGMAAALAGLAADPALRKRVGEANRAKARAEFDETTMVERYRALYWSLMGRK